jgi:hypothetical protein
MVVNGCDFGGDQRPVGVKVKAAFCRLLKIVDGCKRLSGF